ncbi:MAG: L-serine ammonia-lyase [Beijerinckiaceae bacterium]|jgi:L-serine dehydratase
MISTFDLFKIGIGPSSSHTVGPMAAARRFREVVAAHRPLPARITAELFGSLAWTGRGHGTDHAICLGLLGETPAGVDPDAVAGLVAGLRAGREIILGGQAVLFDPASDLVFNFKEIKPLHTNAMRFRALAGDGSVSIEQIYYSIGGGFVILEGEMPDAGLVPAPLAYDSAAGLLELCQARGLGIAEVQMENELAWRTRGEIEAGLDALRDAMFACIERGLRHDGTLPGGLKVRRRAKALHEALLADRLRNSRPPHDIVEWVSLYAIAVNEENAAGGRVVTAPTNGAAGIVPAVLLYFREFCPGWSDERGRAFLLTAAAIGGLIKNRASISGAEVGCQGEVGSAAAMAAAGLAAALGGDPAQIENAAEIAMEHHLGMTCDPIGGLVQIPCIERNAFGANKAIVAASLALRGDGVHHVSLDEVIETMRQTGIDMQDKYKETSRGGLAVNVAEC